MQTASKMYESGSLLPAIFPITPQQLTLTRGKQTYIKHECTIYSSMCTWLNRIMLYWLAYLYILNLLHALSIFLFSTLLRLSLSLYIFGITVCYEPFPHFPAYDFLSSLFIHRPFIIFHPSNLYILLLSYFDHTTFSPFVRSGGEVQHHWWQQGRPLYY